MLALRELERDDIATVNEWRKDRNLINCLGAPYRFIGREIDEKWFDTFLTQRANTVRCAIVDSEDTNAIFGLVTLSGIDWVHRSALMSIMVGAEKDRSRGIGTFAVREILRHAFEDLNLNRVELLVLADNVRAIGLYEKCGFVREGVKREFAFKEGSYKDAIAMAILRSDWREAAVSAEAERSDGGFGSANE